MIDMIVDGNSFFTRAYWAGSAGHKSSVELGISMFCNILNPKRNQLQSVVDRVIFCWDGKPKTDKKRTTKKPDDYGGTLDTFRDSMTYLFGTAVGYSPEHEADDAVATVVKRVKAHSDKVYAVSGDKDISQLAMGNVFYYDLCSKAVLSHLHICSKWDIKNPSQLPIALAILGDKSDGISGIPGWGPKKVRDAFVDVTADMDVKAAKEKVLEHIPDNLKDGFLNSLKFTLLNEEVPGIPDPSNIQFISDSELVNIGLENLLEPYSNLAGHYENR